MKKYKVVWEERHTAIVEANNDEEAQERANELNSDCTTYECCIDQTIEELI